MEYFRSLTPDEVRIEKLYKLIRDSEARASRAAMEKEATKAERDQKELTKAARDQILYEWSREPGLDPSENRNRALEIILNCEKNNEKCLVIKGCHLTSLPPPKALPEPVNTVILEGNNFPPTQNFQGFYPEHVTVIDRDIKPGSREDLLMKQIYPHGYYLLRFSDKASTETSESLKTTLSERERGEPGAFLGYIDSPMPNFD